MTKDKYLLELEQKLAQQEEIIANFKKEQGASITLFKDQARQIENLTSSNSNLIAGSERLTKTNSQLQEQSKNKDKNLKELTKENQSLTKQLETATDETELLKERNQDLTTAKQKNRQLADNNSQLIEKYNQLNSAYQNQAKSLSKTQEELISQQEKNQLLEEKITELDQEPQPCSNCSEWETEKEELLTTFEKTRNEQAETIANLETENNQLDTDLNKAVDLLEGKDKVISQLEKTIAQLKQNPEPKEPTLNKTFLCSECSQAKPQSELSRVFGKFSFCLECSKRARQEAVKEKQAKPQPQEFICHLCEKPKTEIPNLMKLDSTLSEYLVCSSCRPLVKEFNEADLITDDLWEKYPYSSASEILELEFGIVSNKEKSW